MASEIMSTDFQDRLYKGITGEWNQNKSVFLNITKSFGVLHGLNLFSNPEQDEEDEGPKEFTNGVHLTSTGDTQKLADSPLAKVRREAQTMAKDVILTFGKENAGKPPNKYCKTLRRTVRELSTRHDLVFKGIVKKLNPQEENALQTFVTVADELFGEGQVNWGRIVAVYAFAVHLANHLTELTRDIETGEKDNESKSKREDSNKLQEIIAEFVGNYVTNKLGQWIVDHGGWDAFVESFPDLMEFETKLWKYGLMTTLGLGAMATIFATR